MAVPLLLLGPLAKLRQTDGDPRVFRCTAIFKNQKALPECSLEDLHNSNTIEVTAILEQLLNRSGY